MTYYDYLYNSIIPNNNTMSIPNSVIASIPNSVIASKTSATTITVVTIATPALVAHCPDYSHHYHGHYPAKLHKKNARLPGTSAEPSGPPKRRVSRQSQESMKRPLQLCR